MKIISAAFTAVTVIIVTVFFSACMPASAAERTYTEWDGSSELKSGVDYCVSSDVVISEAFSIPKTAYLLVKGGAKLTVADGAAVKCYGTLNISGKSSLVNKGKLLLYSGSKLNVNGAVKQNGNLRTYNKSTVNLNGTFTSLDTSVTRFSGKVTLSDGSVTKLYGNARAESEFTSEAQSALFVYSDSFELTSTSTLSVSGNISFQSASVSALNGNVKISDGGKLTLYGSNTLGGKITVKKGGALIVREKLTAKAASVINVIGTASFYGNGALSGQIVVYTNGLLSLRGKFTAKSASNMTINGTLKVYNTATFTESGSMNIGSGGSVCGNGKMLCSDYNKINCDGELSLPCNGIKTVSGGVTSFGGLIIANKEYTLPSDYNPDVNAEAKSAYDKMYAAASKAGFSSMNIMSGFRSYSYQRYVFNNWCSIYGKAVASTLSAEPGHSEHQTGLAFDISSTKTAYGDTDEGKWLAENCWKYGFIIRYAKDKTDITGYIYEPWHVRYVGVNAAKLIYNSGLCLEEFFGIA